MTVTYKGFTITGTPKEIADLIRNFHPPTITTGVWAGTPRVNPIFTDGTSSGKTTLGTGQPDLQ